MIWFLIACNSGKHSDTGSSSTIVVESSDRLFPPLQDCDDNAPPIVALHGFLASADTYESHAARWAANGHCLDRFFSLDWNTFDQNGSLAELDIYVDTVLSETGASQIDLIGHSAGAGVGVEYVNTIGAGKVRKLVYVGYSPDAEPLEIPMLNLWSPEDKAVPGGSIDGVENYELSTGDHYQVATTEESFAAMYQFLYAEVPQTLQPQTASEAQIWGKAVYFGDNAVIKGSSVEAYRLDPSSGNRLSDEPMYLFETGENGLWGPLPTSNDELWELTLLENPDVPVRHYYAPFENSSNLVRLRGIPEEGLAATILAPIPFADESTVNMVSFSKQQGLIAGRDSLMIDGVEFVVADRADAEDTIIAMFHFDSGSDGESGPDPIQFTSFPFMAGTDSFWAADETQSIVCEFNQQERLIPKWGHGVVLAIY